MTVLALALAVVTIAGIVLFGRRDDPGRTRRRDVPGLPDDGDLLHCWEWDEWDRIEAFYADTADEPARGRRRPS